MKAFEKVIGYDAIKSELMQICDIMHNKERYEALGAKIPNGILLHGAPGLGKTLLVKCFIEECGIEAYTLRNNKGSDKFVEDITETFKLANKTAPSIVFLDDMDKFANDDEDHRDSKEYVAVQAGIDDVKDSGVLVIATTNDIDKLPESLIRAGRFDRTIVLRAPNKNDSAKIIEHYLKGKKISSDVDFNDLCKMISYNSCAELETLVNEAAIHAAYNKKDCIEMEDLLHSVLRLTYNSPDNFMEKDEEEVRKIALHEAGHLVISETLVPGSIGLVSIRKSGRNNTGGFTHRCEDFNKNSYEIMTALGGKVATEMYYSETCASGCRQDLVRAMRAIEIDVTANGSNGLSLIRFGYSPDELDSKIQTVVKAELERYMFQTRDILIKNREFLEKIADALVKKETLLYSDIQRIKESVKLSKTA